MASIKAKQKAAKARQATVIEVTEQEFIRRYLKECNEKTTSFALEVSERLGGIWALIVPRDMLPALIPHMKRHRVTENTMRANGFLHTDANKVALRWNNPFSIHEAKSMAILLGGEMVQVSKKTHAHMKRQSVAEGLPNAGFMFEKMLADAIGGVVIGQSDRKDHTYHSDVELPNGEQIECKSRTGFFSLRYDGGAIKYRLV